MYFYLQNNVTMDLINKLPEKDRDELLKLLPPADIDFVKRNHDDEDDTSSSIIVAKSLDEHEQLSNQPETYKPIISQRLISPSFTQAIEDFQVNLQHGRYDNNPKPATGRGRKRKEVVVEEQHDDFKVNMRSQLEEEHKLNMLIRMSILKLIGVSG